MNLFSTNAKLVPAICTQCSSSIEVDPSEEKAVCKYCQTSFVVQKAINNFNVQNAKIEHVETMNIINNKRGAVETVLNFVEKQQDKKQQKIDEEKRRQEEEKRKQEEQRKMFMNQLINKKYRKRNLVILSFLFVVILALSIIGGGTTEESGNIAKINMPASSSDLEGKNYQDVLINLKDAGFTNIQTEAIDDLLFGLFTKDGEIEEVSVDGYTTFSADSRYPADIEIIVTYHTFPVVEEEEVAESSTPVSIVEAEPTEKVQSTEVTQSSAEEEIITVDNNEEFAAILIAKEPGDQIIHDFAVKYAGRIIAFDGNIAHMIHNGDYSTRYDFLIFPWDYSETTSSGPNFKFENRNYYDLNLIGNDVPDTVGIGDNLHFVAKIIEYNETQELFFLDPISTEVR